MSSQRFKNVRRKVFVYFWAWFPIKRWSLSILLTVFVIQRFQFSTRGTCSHGNARDVWLNKNKVRGVINKAALGSDLDLIYMHKKRPFLENSFEGPLDFKCSSGAKQNNSSYYYYCLSASAHPASVALLACVLSLSLPCLLTRSFTRNNYASWVIALLMHQH